MLLELFQDGRPIGTVVLSLAKPMINQQYTDIRGYSAVVITGITHNYNLVFISLSVSMT